MPPYEGPRSDDTIQRINTSIVTLAHIDPTILTNSCLLRSSCPILSWPDDRYHCESSISCLVKSCRITSQANRIINQFRALKSPCVGRLNDRQNFPFKIACAAKIVPYAPAKLVRANRAPPNLGTCSLTKANTSHALFVHCSCKESFCQRATWTNNSAIRLRSDD